MSERTEVIEKPSSISKILDHKYGTFQEQLVKAGVVSFEPETREALALIGLERFILLGTPQPTKPGVHDERVTTYPSTRTEVAILNRLALSGSGNKTFEEQQELLAQFADDLSRKIPNIDVRLGSIGEYAELARAFVGWHFKDAFIRGRIFRTSEPIAGGEKYTREKTVYDIAETTTRRNRSFMGIPRSPEVIRSRTNIPRKVVIEGVTPRVGMGMSTQMYFWRFGYPEITYISQFRLEDLPKPDDILRGLAFNVSPHSINVSEASPNLVIAPLIFPKKPEVSIAS